MIPAIVWRGSLLAVLWWVLVEGSVDAWGVGAVSVMLALAASLYLTPPGPIWITPTGLLAFVAYFLVESLRGGLQVAIMALRPSMNLAPHSLDVPLRLPPGPPTVLLVSTLSLMPGTLCVCIEAQSLRLHVLDDRLPVVQEVRAMEAHVARLFGIAL